MMKKQNRPLQFISGLMTEIGDQIVCFMMLSFMLFSMVSGAITLFSTPPSVGIVLGIMAFGVFFGALRFFTSGQLTEKIDNKD